MYIQDSSGSDASKAGHSRAVGDVTTPTHVYIITYADPVPGGSIYGVLSLSSLHLIIPHP